MNHKFLSYLSLKLIGIRYGLSDMLMKRVRKEVTINVIVLVNRQKFFLENVFKIFIYHFQASVKAVTTILLYGSKNCLIFHTYSY